MKREKSLSPPSVLKDAIKNAVEKLPYEPPAIEQEETFETLALACAKGPGVGRGCGPGHGAS